MGSLSHQQQPPIANVVHSSCDPASVHVSTHYISAWFSILSCCLFCWASPWKVKCDVVVSSLVRKLVAKPSCDRARLGKARLGGCWAAARRGALLLLLLPLLPPLSCLVFAVLVCPCGASAQPFLLFAMLLVGLSGGGCPSAQGLGPPFFSPFGVILGGWLWVVGCHLLLLPVAFLPGCFPAGATAWSH